MMPLKIDSGKYNISQSFPSLQYSIVHICFIIHDKLLSYTQIYLVTKKIWIPTTFSRFSIFSSFRKAPHYRKRRDIAPVISFMHEIYHFLFNINFILFFNTGFMSFDCVWRMRICFKHTYLFSITFQFSTLQSYCVLWFWKMRKHNSVP